MPKYKVEIFQAALDDLEADVDCIAQDSISAAMRWYGEVVEKIQSLEALPKRCPVAEESRFFDFEVRQLIIGSYRVLFRIVEDVVQVLHVKHGAQERKPFSVRGWQLLLN